MMGRLAVSFVEDPSIALAPGNWPQVRLWDVSTGVETGRLEGHVERLNRRDWQVDGVSALAVLPD